VRGQRGAAGCLAIWLWSKKGRRICAERRKSGEALERVAVMQRISLAAREQAAAVEQGLLSQRKARARS